MTGSTFAVLFCQDAIHVVDSHRHETPVGRKGWVWAQSSHWHEMLTWIFDRGGLLEQLHCRTDFVDAVVLDLGVVQANPSPDVAPVQQAPGALVGQVPGAAEAEVARAAREAEDARAACSHAEFQSRCPQCHWEKHRAKFCRLSAYVDRITFLEDAAVALSPSSNRFDLLSDASSARGLPEKRLVPPREARGTSGRRLTSAIILACRSTASRSTCEPQCTRLPCGLMRHRRRA